MQSQAVRSRNSKGSVSILVSNKQLQLRFHFKGKRHYLSLGLPDSKLNRKAAEAKAKLIKSDNNNDVKQRYIKIYLNGMELQGIERVTNIHHITVMGWVREAGLRLPDPPESEEEPEINDLDGQSPQVGRPAHGTIFMIADICGSQTA